MMGEVANIKPRIRNRGAGVGMRPMPRDFPETFARVGWDGIEAEYRAHKDTIKRWMVEFGEDELKAGRRAFLEVAYAAMGKRIPGRRPGRAKRYVLGRTLSAVNSELVEG
jgi:hypothetical protein